MGGVASDMITGSRGSWSFQCGAFPRGQCESDKDSATRGQCESDKDSATERLGALYLLECLAAPSEVGSGGGVEQLVLPMHVRQSDAGRASGGGRRDRYDEIDRGGDAAAELRGCGAVLRGGLSWRQAWIRGPWCQRRFCTPHSIGEFHSLMEPNPEPALSSFHQAFMDFPAHCDYRR
jgi:hypothetical protein